MLTRLRLREGAENIDLTKHHTMQQLHEPWIGYIFLFFLIANVGIQVFSHVGLSAVIKSNRQLSVGEADLSDVACIGEPGYDAFKTYWETMVSGKQQGSTHFKAAQEICGEGFAAGATNLEAFGNCLANNAVYGGQPLPGECLECYAFSPVCAFDNCLSQCTTLEGADAPACRQCSGDNCNPPVEACLGVTIDPDRRRRGLQGFEEDVSVIYEISFVSSVRDALNGKAYGIAFTILIFSGIWPYAKNVIMFVAWFVPMTSSFRSMMLKNLTRFARWSLVDVFAVVIIVAGVRIDKDLNELGSLRLIVFAESRIAIYTFALAAIQDIMQGEYIHYMHTKILERNGKLVGSALHEDSPLKKGTMVDAVYYGTNDEYICSRVGKAVLLCFFLVQVAIAVVGVVLPNMNFKIGGSVSAFDGRNEFDYSAVTLGTALIEEPYRSENDSLPGTIWLMLVYLVMGIVIPIWEYTSMAVLAFTGPSLPGCSTSMYKSYMLALDILGAFTCMDVFVLAFVVVLAEWDKFINAAIAGAGAEGAAGFITMNASVLAGLYLIVLAAVLGWFAELYFAYSFAQLYHPIESVWLSRNIFDALVKPPLGKIAEKSSGKVSSSA